jgi:hypothetical protein
MVFLLLWLSTYSLAAFLLPDASSLSVCLLPPDVFWLPGILYRSFSMYYFLSSLFPCLLLSRCASRGQDSGASMVALYKAMSKQAKDVAAFIDKQIPELEKLYEPVGKLYAAYQGALDAYTKFMEQWKGKLPESDFSGRALELVQTEIEKSLR